MQRYLTDRKRAVGLGSGRAGTEHHWKMMVSSMAIVVAAPVFFILFALGYQLPYAEATAYFGHPAVAITLAVTMVIIIRHVMNEAIEAAEDYVHGTAGQLTIVGITWASYLLMIVGLFALARMAI
ncbi:MAG: succinate dehydrogenase [Rhodobacteraceae bacterium]|nr:succinate dehydrogenase [Paracoccaceae bacterium]